MNFVHLHTHSYYSLLDGLARPEQIASQAKKFGCNAVSLTDHGVMYGAIDFYKACQKEEIKAVLGCEVYVAINGRKDKRPHIDNKRFHLLLLAYNQTGYENLLKLTTKAHLEGYYYKPRVDLELIAELSEGLIASSACLQGHIPQAILQGNKSKAKEHLDNFQKIFGEKNFFLEVQDHPHLSNQQIANTGILELAKENGVPLIATNDTHYLCSEDAEAHDVMLCIQTNSQIQDENRMTMLGEDFSLRDPASIATAFSDYPEAITNTQMIADRCEVNFTFGKYLIPSFNIPDKKSDKLYLRELCFEGAIKRYQLTTKFQLLINNKLEKISEDEKKVIDRLNYELQIIDQMGFNNYFLIVWDFIKYAKNNKILVGPGRGSAAGSLVSYVLEITNLDPLKHGLLFERFLNPERVSMPDIDIDFADHRRDDVLKYVISKYGQKNVAQICTFGTMAARASVKDVGRVMGVSFAEMNNLAKLIPEKPGTKLQEALNSEEELRKAYKSSDLYHKIIDIALKLEGTVRHISVHACAVIISPDPLVKYTALQHPPKDDTAIITQFSAKPLETLGLLKMDFLGLKNLTIIEKALEMIKKLHNKVIDIDNIPMDDAPSYEVFAKGETTGIFQFESSGMRRYLKELKPTAFDDIVAMVSLYRPGPMEWIPDYMKGKHGKKKVKYLHPSLEKILKTTYGIGIYQEQILEIARDFAGFSLGEADILRKAIGKKIASELMSQKEKFIIGADKNGYDKKTALLIFEKVIEPFAGYGFNKSHAAGYSLIAYQTAFLKAHYPAEFMAALMSCDSGNTDKIILESEECRCMGITVLPPDINESFTNFTIVDKNKIRFGLSAIKGLGDGPIENIITIRNKGKFKTLEDFIQRIDAKVVNKKTFEALVKSGALDSLGERNMIIENFDKLTAYKKEAISTKNNGQTNLFGLIGESSLNTLELDQVKEASQSQKLAWEKETMGLYVTAHPLAGLQEYLKRKVFPLGKITEKEVGKISKLGGLITSRKKITTKKGDTMMIMEIADLTGKITATFFPKTYKIFAQACQTKEFLVITGKIEIRNGLFQIIVQEAKTASLDLMRENAKNEKMFDFDDTGLDSYIIKDDPTVDQTEKNPVWQIPVPTGIQKKDLLKLKNLLSENRGETPVSLYLKDNNQIVKIPVKVTISEKLKKKVAKLWDTKSAN